MTPPNPGDELEAPPHPSTPDETTSAASFIDRAREVCKNTFGFDSFRAGQQQAIEAVAAGKDCVVIMPTGSGKSLCYQIPALVHSGVTLVVSPLIALMKDQVDALLAKNVAVTQINSSLSTDEQWARLEQLRRGSYKLVYVAPERFRSGAFRRALSEIHVSLLAVDESHCISQWGHDFRPDYRRLSQVRELLGGVPVIALTATATPEVQDDIARELVMEDPERVIVGFDRPNLHYSVEKARGGADKQAKLTKFLKVLIDQRQTDEVPSGIIYTATRKHAEEIAVLLSEKSWKLGDAAPDVLCRAYHAGLPDDERRSAQEDFMTNRLPWVAATNAFGMGVDKSQIRFVVHYDIPGSLESYYQEVGRAGRDGKPAHCRLLLADSDRMLQQFFIEGANPSPAILNAVYDFLWMQGVNPIFKSLVELEKTFNRMEIFSERINPMAFRSSIIILERAGGLERLNRRENLAEVGQREPDRWQKNPFPESARIKHSIWNALHHVFQTTDGETARLSVSRWARELSLSDEAIRRGLAHLQEEDLIQYTPPFRGRAIRLPSKKQTLQDLGVDFAALKQKRLREEDRLIQMLSFGRSNQCRRNQILAHFGAPLPGPNCGICDLCLGDGPSLPLADSRPLDEEESTVVRMILSGVGRAKGRCGRQRLIQMLVGSSAAPVQSLGLDRLSTFGILKDMKQTVLREILDQLEMAGCIRQEGDRYPVLHLTEKGWKVIMEETDLPLPLPPFSRRGQKYPAASPSTTSSSSSSSRAVEEEEPYDEELFDRLRQLRFGVAQKLGVPAYMVFSNKSLKDLARRKPLNEKDFLAAHGVGPVTFEKFGTAFLAEISRDVGRKN